MNCLEKSEEASSIVMSPELQLVSDSGDAADHRAISSRQEKLDCRVLMEWMLLRIDELANVTP